MNLLPSSIARELPPLYSQEDQGDQAVARVRFFTPDSSWTWWATEYDPDDRVFFGLVNGFEAELGYFALAELEAARGPMGLPIERDLYFQPKTLAEIRAEITEGMN